MAPKKFGGRGRTTQGFVGSTWSIVTDAENRSLVVAVGMFTASVAFLHSSWSEFLLPA
ncbi:uncharacterized protein K452DRAFT_284359 [Aplosporella prunicola CBS 121167]|uniref:TOM core complex subunit Tom6 n=1 Tax=Aplosporella prunicola CBS 121167 TaxID=1176127 RepID=A0A6A6BQ81_9PEZI|nr:uncharacterized protein K452DRAFT_284359 [Aplosporella prunicola CBS 121167]KAF2144967.1 hypothetical protein K452DRAFT_284359 [Aplosporella prunicola CBS 121167]